MWNRALPSKTFLVGYTQVVGWGENELLTKSSLLRHTDVSFHIIL